MSSRPKKLTDEDFTRLANFRYALRCFLEFSENAVAGEGLTPQQHQALLVIRASPDATANIARLAERLRIRHNTAVELAQRLESAGLISRVQNDEDRRTVLLNLTEEGTRKLETLTVVHRQELAQLSPQILQLFDNLKSTLE
ncbi:MAG: MarR family transcriptional regulator [Luteolibacter sp.]